MVIQTSKNIRQLACACTQGVCPAQRSQMVLPYVFVFVGWAVLSLFIGAGFICGWTRLLGTHTVGESRERVL